MHLPQILRHARQMLTRPNFSAQGHGKPQSIGDETQGGSHVKRRIALRWFCAQG